MIYGSMYDAVMNWALNDEDEKDKITKPSTKRSSKQPTGTLESDKIKNIYDLGNNLYEWTLGAEEEHDRIFMGGNFNYGDPPSVCYGNVPRLTTNVYGTRLSLYINVQ